MRIYRMLAAWLALMLLIVAMPTALAEDAAPMPDAEAAYEAPADDAPEADGDGAVEEAVPLADDAGDTGLTIDYGDAPEAASERELPLEEAAANEDEAVEAPDAEAEDGEALEILALPEIDPGYVAVAPEAPVYADAARTQAIGVFPEGAVVYAEPVEEDAALLRIRAQEPNEFFAARCDHTLKNENNDPAQFAKQADALLDRITKENTP